MKVCPECKETFANELNFCDVDGVKLMREGGASAAGEQSKLWQLLGVGLLLGALVLSAASIFLPKTRVLSPTPVSSTSAEPASNRPTPNDSAAKASSTPAVSDETPVSTDELALAETKRKDKSLLLTTQTGSTPGPNPKAAAQAAEESDKPQIDQAPKTAPPLPPAPDPAASAKNASETRESPAPPKPSATPAESKEPRKQPAETKSSGKDSGGKKKVDDKDKEKKGGFLRVFKKIFGKD